MTPWLQLSPARASRLLLAGIQRLLSSSSDAASIASPIGLIIEGLSHRLPVATERHRKDTTDAPQQQIEEDAAERKPTEECLRFLLIRLCRGDIHLNGLTRLCLFWVDPSFAAAPEATAEVTLSLELKRLAHTETADVWHYLTKCNFPFPLLEQMR